MKASLFQKIENTFAAAAFAEAGEHDTARRLAGLNTTASSKVRDFFRFLEKQFMAASFAEAGCADMALQYVDSQPRCIRPRKTLETFLETVGLNNARVCYGLARI